MFIANRPLRFFQLRQERDVEPEVDAAPNGAEKVQWEDLLYKYFAPNGAGGHPLFCPLTALNVLTISLPSISLWFLVAVHVGTGKFVGQIL